MIRSLIFLPFFINSTYLIAQEQFTLSAINLSVILPSNVEGLSDNQLSKLESKIISAVTNNGVSSVGYVQNYVIYPKFEINDKRETQGGMRNIHVLNCTISLFIKQVNSNIIFSSYSKNLQGSGFNSNEALNNAISAFDINEQALNDFIIKGKEKIITYFHVNCDNILKKAESEKLQKKYESSLSILLTIPEESGVCYEKAQTKAKSVFADLQKYNCKNYILKAKTSDAAQDYSSALQYLSWIDPESICAKESEALIKSISNKVSIESKKQWDFLLKSYTDRVALQKFKIESMNNLMINWLQTQQPNRSYITIIK